VPPPEQAGTADLLRIDLRPADQIIETANAVPDPIRCRVLTHQQGTDAGQGVFRGGVTNGCLALSVEQLPALALANRVIGQHRQTILRQQDRPALDVIRRLAVVAVADRPSGRRGTDLSHPASRALAVDVVLRPALVDHLLDAVAVAFFLSTVWALSGVFSGKPPSDSMNQSPQLLLPLVDVVGRLQSGDHGPACVEMLLGLAKQVIVEHLSGGLSWGSQKWATQQQ